MFREGFGDDCRSKFKGANRARPQTNKSSPAQDGRILLYGEIVVVPLREGRRGKTMAVLHVKLYGRTKECFRVQLHRSRLFEISRLATKE
jgi:hypothetical protein